MKRVIDIPEGMLDELHTCKFPIQDAYRLCEVIENGTPLPECKDCRFFEYDFVTPVDGVPLILGHELCKKWGDGCKTSEHGYCFLFEAKEGRNDETD